MILFLAYALFIIAFIQAIIVIYNIVCCVTLRLFKKEVDESTESNVENRKTRFNIYIGLIKISRKIKRVTSPNELKKEVKKQVIGKTFLAIFLSFSLIIYAIQSFTYGLVVYELNNQLQTVAGAFNILLSGDKDCPCYARCTGNSDDDGRSVYELIFGYDEYVKLTDAMVLTDEEYELFYGVGRYGEELEMQEGAHGEYLKSYNEVVLSMDGKSQSEFIRDHINDDMVNIYQQAIFAKNNNIRNDGFDRKKAEVDDLRKDLYNLLSDYKVNGRNPNCKCNTVSQKLLGNVCMGCDHWHEGWMWNTIYYNDDPTLGGGTGGPGGGILPDPDYPTISGGGAQNSTYGVQLDDGWYYWYQQRRCSCKHNPVDPTYGSYAHLYLNHPNGTNPYSGNQAAARGCSTYSTSMAISNALGMEVTPYVLLKDIVGGSFVPVGGGYEFTGIGAGLDLSTAPPGLNITTLGNKAVQLYGDKGLQFKKINNGNKAELDAALDEGYFVVVSVHGGPSPWYSGNGHYIVLRKRVGDKYYCLDSNCNDNQAYARMTTPVSWAALSSCMSTHGGCGGAFKGPGIQEIKPTPSGGYSKEDIEKDIAAGLYTLEDFSYLVALEGESGSYEGFYAVASSVRNRVTSNWGGHGSYKGQVTAPGQYSGYHSARVSNPFGASSNIIKAAVDILRGGASSVGGCCSFFGRVNDYDMWADAGTPEFYNWGGNIFHNGGVHNKKGTDCPSGGILIYNHKNSTWIYPSGTKGP